MMSRPVSDDFLQWESSPSVSPMQLYQQQPNLELNMRICGHEYHLWHGCWIRLYWTCLACNERGKKKIHLAQLWKNFFWVNLKPNPCQNTSLFPRLCLPSADETEQTGCPLLARVTGQPVQDAEQPAAGSVEQWGGGGGGVGGGREAEGSEPAAAGGAVQSAAHLRSPAEPGGAGEGSLSQQQHLSKGHFALKVI